MTTRITAAICFLIQNYTITRLRVKDGSSLNALRADFKSIEEVKTFIRSGKIDVGIMIHPIRPYHLLIRTNKCLKCLRHDHTTKTCSRPRLSPKCTEEHSLEHGCQNQERCVNCRGDQISGHYACAVVQEKRQALVELSKRQRAELLVLPDRQQNQFGYQEREFPAISNDMPIHLSSSVQPQQMNVSQRTYAQV
ncbi:unnamed protein product [Rotaria socialis]|uniref:Gag-like protein n=3 Tax=Rotaria socialis TaxID=392032 RepID=A0A818B8T4_9BILA|nr:unnamed protein product [Rotaria socialis]CAF3330999.1 unnamed protein product [Rotaria socialis]CAF3416902.1 unnamed protein product [Rotaria socialis]CAF3519134.1 unnamed protein product [Rotaria socialis]CAF4437608.1 unnamed protein product [Rotaria socialis]